MARENPLDRWRRERELSKTETARQIGEALNTAERYMLPLDHPRFRIPRRDPMRAIYVATQGRVTPNDFYDLPPLEAEAAA